MKKRVRYLQAGYADLVLPRVMVVIVFVLGLVALPAYFNYDKRSKLMPILNGLQQSVGEGYATLNRVPDLATVEVVAGKEFVTVQNGEFHVSLALLGEDVEDKYLQLQPYMEQGHLAWNCTYIGDLYRDDIPAQRDGICENSRLALEERPLPDRFLNFMRRIWGFTLACLLVIGVTFVFG